MGTRRDAARPHPGFAGKLKKECFPGEMMVLLERFELSASPLPRECSTPEL